MSGWVKFENSTPDNLKVELVSDGAFRLWFNASCYCSRGLTDGIVSADRLRRLYPKVTKRLVHELVKAGLLDQIDAETFKVHDYLTYNPSRAEVKDMQAEAAERRKDNRDRVNRYRARLRGNPVELEVLMLERDGGACLRCGATEDLVMDHIKPLRLGGVTELDNVQTLCRGCSSRKRRQTTDYRRPDVTAPVTGYAAVTDPGAVTGDVSGDPRARDRSGPIRTGRRSSDEGEEDVGTTTEQQPTKESELQRATTDALLIVDTLAKQIRMRDPKAKVNPRSELWLRDARLLIERDNRTRDEILDVLNWLPTHQSGDFAWSSAILSMGTFRAKFTQLTIAMGNGTNARGPSGRRKEMKHGEIEAQNEAWAAWLRENMPDITWGPEHGTLHRGAWRMLWRISVPISELSVEEHGDLIRRSVAAYDREEEEARAA